MQQQLIRFLVGLCAFLALLTMVDFIFEGSSIIETVQSNTQQQQRYYNAAGNSHYSYRVKTASYHTPVSEGFKSTLSPQDSIKITTSLLFNEVNKVENMTTSERETYSMRYFSGLAIPLLLLLVIEIVRKKFLKLYTLLFVLCVLTVANFIFILN